MASINYQELGKETRRDIINSVISSGRGHIGSAFSLVEILLVLYNKVLKFDPKNPKWDERDRFILSKGHGCLALYSLLAQKGFFPKEELSKFCSLDGMLGGHPEVSKVPGIEASTGALGHGLSIGIGMALRAKMDKMNYRVFVTLGDGECNEGTIWEAAMSAAKNKLNNLVVLVDYNKYQSYGPVSEVLNLEPFPQKWQAFGFDVHEADLNNVLDFEDIMLNKVNYQGSKPTVVICHTIKGKGVSFTENNLQWHHKNKLTPEEIKALNEALA